MNDATIDNMRFHTVLLLKFFKKYQFRLKSFPTSWAYSPSCTSNARYDMQQQGNSNHTIQSAIEVRYIISARRA